MRESPFEEVTPDWVEKDKEQPGEGSSVHKGSWGGKNESQSWPAASVLKQVITGWLHDEAGETETRATSSVSGPLVWPSRTLTPSLSYSYEFQVQCRHFPHTKHQQRLYMLPSNLKTESNELVRYLILGKKEVWICYQWALWWNILIMNFIIFISLI